MVCYEESIFMPFNDFLELQHTAEAPKSNALYKAIDEKLRQKGIDNFKVDFSAIPETEWIIQSIKGCAYTGAARSLFIEGKVCELLAIQLNNHLSGEHGYGGTSNEAGDTELFTKIKLYLEVNFLGNLSLKTLSREFGINECKLKSGYKAMFGTSIFAYVKSLKMDLAKSLLSKKKSTVYQVADALKYKNAHHFSAAFKRYFNESPGAYRKRSLSA